MACCPFPFLPMASRISFCAKVGWSCHSWIPLFQGRMSQREVATLRVLVVSPVGWSDLFLQEEFTEKYGVTEISWHSCASSFAKKRVNSPPQEQRDLLPRALLQPASKQLFCTTWLATLNPWLCPNPQFFRKGCSGERSAGTTLGLKRER
jgi:hypothetical protein